MTAAMVNQLIALIDSTCILLVIAYLIIRSQFFFAFFDHRETLRNQGILALLFGAFTGYGILTASSFPRGLISISIIGPVAGAFTGGLWVGLGAALLGAGACFWKGGFTAQSAILAAGALAGIFSLWKLERPVRIREAAIFVVGFEICWNGALFLGGRIPSPAAAVLPLTAISSLLGVTGLIFILERMVDERKTSAAKELIESELRVASNIQMSIVPKTFPPSPNLPEVEVFAVLQSAKEVGGDLYDFFKIDDDHFCFLIGDVSGKGMPAALFMAVTRTLIKSNSEPGVTPDLILRRVNNELCQGNDSSMFVTVFCGILNLRTGEVCYSNAGHNPPYLYRSNRSLEVVNLPEGMALGVMEDMPYTQERLTLRPGDSFVAYTDGANEAMDICSNQFTNERLECTIKGAGTPAPKEVIRKIMEDLQRFTAGAEQSDDITLLVLNYLGGQGQKP